MVERLVDAASCRLGIAPDDLRRRNYLPRSDMPYTAPTGLSFETADFERNMDDAMRLADWDGHDRRRAEARARGRLRGIGMASYVESCGGGGMDDEEAAIVFEADGRIAVHVGTQDSGQGHGTAFAQIVAERLGADFASIRMVQGDTDVIGFGRGTVGSRSLALCGSAIAVAADRIVAKATGISAQMLEAAGVDIEFADGVFSVAGTDRRVMLTDVAAAAREPAAAAEAGVEPGHDERVRYTAEAATLPNGCHVCEVEVEPETGAVEIVRYTWSTTLAGSSTR